MIRVAIAALLLTVSICDAFVVPSQSVSFVVSGKSVGLYAAAEGEQPPESETKEPVFAETTSDKDQDEEDEETEPEDEVTFLKQEIADLETILKAKQLLVEYHQEKVEQYSKDGYARKVAEMETMRRSRARINSSSKETAMASVVQNFLPILEDLEQLQEQYGNDDFGKSYNALSGILRSGMKELGVEDFDIQAGSFPVDGRVSVVAEEYSEEFPQGTVIRTISTGMELQGNVIKMAECVVSLGKEEVEEEKDSNKEENTDEEQESYKEEEEETMSEEEEIKMEEEEAKREE